MGHDLGAAPEELALIDDDFIITTLSCPFCGAGYEIYDTPAGYDLLSF